MSSMNFWNLNLGSGSSGDLYSLFSERSMIKNGTYKKLLKSYYGSQQETAGASSSTKKSCGSDIIDQLLKEKMYPTVSKETQKANSNLTSGISTLQGAVSTLQNENTYQDTENGKTAADKAVEAVKSYVTSYNDVVKSSKLSTLSNKTAYVANMMNYTSKSADQLAEIGVTLKSDNTLMVDETKLKAADTSKIQKLFSSDNIQSYGSMIASRAKFAGSATTVSAPVNTDNKTETDTKKPTVTSAATLKADGEALASASLYTKVKGEDGKYAYNVDKILSTAKSFADNYNGMFSAAESSSNSGVLSNLSYIREKTKNSTASLKEFGISVDSKGRMKLDEETFKKADMSKVKDFFKDYGSFVAANASRVNFYASTNADASSGYTSNALYNIPNVPDYSQFM